MSEHKALSDTALATIGGTEDDERWLDQLFQWRDVCCRELLEIKSPIRDPKVLSHAKNLELSISCIDRGLRVLKDSPYSFESLRLGQLMRESGYQQQPEDLLRKYGSLKDAR